MGIVIVGIVNILVLKILLLQSFRVNVIVNIFFVSILYYYLYILDFFYDVFSLFNIFEIREFLVIKVINDWFFFNIVIFLYVLQGQRGISIMFVRLV